METPINRRDVLTLVGAGCLSAMLPGGPDAEANCDSASALQRNASSELPVPNLMHTAKRTAANSQSLDETYFWLDGHTLLFLRQAPGKTVFRAVLVDALTGRQTLPKAFNDRNSPLMEAGRMTVSIQGSPKSVMHYLPPPAALSPDRKWLLWDSQSSPPGRNHWVACTLNGQQQKWLQGSDPESTLPRDIGHALWMPDSKHWVELVSRYAGRAYSIHLAHVYMLGKSTPVRTVRISGLDDGLPVGIRQDGTVVMHMPPRQSERPTQQLVMSLVSLGADTVFARNLSLPIPLSSDISDVTLSPKGDRLVWILTQGRGLSSQHTLYVADADGAHARPVGSAQEVRIGNEYSWPLGLRWLPDGKQVSFVYKNAIFTIPV